MKKCYKKYLQKKLQKMDLKILLLNFNFVIIFVIH